MENIMTNAFLAMKFLLKAPEREAEEQRRKQQAADNSAAITDIQVSGC